MAKVMYDPMRNLFFTMSEVVDGFGNSRGSWTCVPDSTPGEFIYTVVPAASPSYTVKHSELIPRALSDVPKFVYNRVRCHKPDNKEAIALHIQGRGLYLVRSLGAIDQHGTVVGAWKDGPGGQITIWRVGEQPLRVPKQVAVEIFREEELPAAVLSFLRDVQRSDGLPPYPDNTVPPVHTEPPCGGNLPTNPKQLYGDKKVPMGLVPASFMAHTATALLEGVLKYGAWNFRASPVEAMTYAHAAMRHIEKWVNGEECDPQSKVHHLGNAAACMAILLDTMAHGTLLDNRPPAQDLNNLFTQLEGTIAHLREIHKDAKPTHYTNGSAGTTA